MDWRGVVLRPAFREWRSEEIPSACRAFSQASNSRAWRADNLLTLLMASSTVLMQCILSAKLACGNGANTVSAASAEIDKKTDAVNNAPLMAQSNTHLARNVVK